MTSIVLWLLVLGLLIALLTVIRWEHHRASLAMADKLDFATKRSNFQDMVGRRSFGEDMRAENGGPTDVFEQFPIQRSPRPGTEEKWPGTVSTIIS